jgi:hypothetical protein
LVLASSTLGDPLGLLVIAVEHFLTFAGIDYYSIIIKLYTNVDV